MTTRQETCEERIATQLAGRMESLSAFVKATHATSVDDLTDDDLIEVTNDNGVARSEFETDRGMLELCDLAQEQIYALPLSVETTRVVKILLSSGGPADWFEAHLDDEGDIVRIEYVFQDWFDSARRTLDGAEFDAAEEFCRHFTESF